ncbi:MAG: hypothetical protein AABP62_31255 [Planctomycetota bacterium]
MVTAPHRWKQQLKRTAAELDRRRSQVFWRASSYASLEQTVMFGFYAVRKLIEGGWVDHRLRDTLVPVTSFPALPRPVMHRFAYPTVDQHFDLSRPQQQQLTLKKVCDQIIHSFVFTPAFAANRLVAIYFSSYKCRNKVHRAEITELAKVWRATAASRYVLLLHSGPEFNRYDER